LENFWLLDVGPIPRQFLTRTDGFFGSLDHLTLSNKLIRRQVAERAVRAALIIVEPPGAGRTTAPGSRRAGRAPRYHNDAPLCASGAQSSPGWDPGVGVAEYPLPVGTRVIHRTACHAGVTGFFANRVSRGVPNGIFQKGGRFALLPDKGSCLRCLVGPRLKSSKRWIHTGAWFCDGFPVSSLLTRT
jgi:hypothetical protein